MPELRVLTERLVKTSVERAMASLLDRQRELEAKLERSGGSSAVKPHDFEAKLKAAIAPLLAKQSELEMMLGALRHAQVRPRPSPGGGAPHVPELPTSTGRDPVEVHGAAPRGGPPPLPTQAMAPRPSAVEPPAMAAQKDPFAVPALSANTLVDLPAELNGSRRKRLVVFLLLLTVIGVLATVASLSVMSNMGAYP